MQATSVFGNIEKNDHLFNLFPNVLLNGYNKANTCSTSNFTPAIEVAQMQNSLQWEETSQDQEHENNRCLKSEIKNFRCGMFGCVKEYSNRSRLEIHQRTHVNYIFNF